MDEAIDCLDYDARSHHQLISATTCPSLTTSPTLTFTVTTPFAVAGTGVYTISASEPALRSATLKVPHPFYGKYGASLILDPVFAITSLTVPPRGAVTCVVIIYLWT